ncbi:MULTISPECIES: hypothetical protein [Mycobacterium avium complex (MAC)]|uniref:hypothetical protein n=1 Tax=Mycobacterium avium complex (MAC) TaxID=120793 RepID=UPI00044FA210|nr:hypothetical protein [Mycobacterium intracellulare]ETZ39889.1 hypothetical protein L843_0178 [Mycobacterium intracellulare MIN_061107_1834]MCA2273539.1 hypothetical protein [Mycobacterium intracellulare]UEB24829.1 hypothetical protein LK403_00830 [Mycobacterium intracellulare]BCO60159.1 hypothetical protein MINTM006_01090 [Mycobacterium intracellulare]BCO70776.1 hypothetical protein MINTM008_01110 [Mycobacterium intracellulare]
MYLRIEGHLDAPQISVERADDCRTLYATSRSMTYDTVARALEEAALGRSDTDPDLWLKIDALKSLASTGSESWSQEFDAMIAFAATRGWIDDSGRYVAAHLVADE